MTDRTHSHDTSTPAMSAETVPSEEFVLVPREAEQEAGTGSMRHDNEDGGIVMVACGQCQGIGCDFCDGFGHFNRPVRPTLSASHFAKEGGDAVREALKPFALVAEQDIGLDECDTDRFTPISDAGRRGPRLTVGHLRRAREAYAALSTPTEGPASQMEGIGGDVKTILRAALQEYGLGESLLGEHEKLGRHSAIRGMMVRMGLYPVFCELLAKDATDDEIEAALSTPTEGPASQAEDSDDQGRPWKDYETDTSEPSPFMQRINEEMGR